MYLLRRTAARAIASSPSTALFAKPRFISSIAPAAIRATQPRCFAPSFQRRWASDETSESFAQTATEAPVEENLTPAQEAVQAPSTDASATVDTEALEEAAEVPITTVRSQRSRINSDMPVTPNKCLYVGNLFYEVTTEQLKRVFSRFGEIESVSIVYDNRGLSRGFAYVDFKNLDDATAAAENLDMQVFEGRNLVVQYHTPKSNKSRSRDAPTGANSPSRTLFIGNMSFEMSDKDLNDLFRDIRNVMDVRVAIDRRTGQPRGFAHADFVDVASATRAKELLQGKLIYGRQLRVDYSASETRSAREPRGEPRGENRS